MTQPHKPLKTITVTRNDVHEIVCADCSARVATDYGAREITREIIRYHLAQFHPDATGAQYWTRETIIPDNLESGE